MPRPWEASPELQNARPASRSIDEGRLPYFTTEDGCRLFYDIEGFESSKPVLAFLNGTMQSTLYWKRQATLFKEQYQVLTYDARAQGQSDLGSGRLSLEAHVEDFRQLVRYLGIQKAHLVGLSHGAKIALAYTAHSAEHVERIVLCSVGAAPSCRGNLFVQAWLDILKSSGLEAMVWACLPVVLGEKFLRHKERTLKSIVKAIVVRNRKEALIAHLEAVLHYPPLSQIAGDIENPCMVISGSEDPFVPEDKARELAALCGGEHKLLLGIGHSIPVEAPELFDQTVLNFLER